MMKKGCRIGIIFSVPILAVLLIKYIVPAYQRFTTGKLLPCIYYATTGYLCPGCGVTRSIYALAKGNILLSLRNNPIVLLIILFLILFYIEILSELFGKSIKAVPRNKAVICLILGGLMLFYILRNFIGFLAPL